MQYDDPQKLGYLPRSVAVRYIINSQDYQKQQAAELKQLKQKEALREVMDIDEDFDLEHDTDMSPEERGKKYFEKFSSKAGSGVQKQAAAVETCQRCHLLKNYGKVVPIRIPVEEFRSKLQPIKDMNVVVVKVVDIMDFNGTFVNDFRRIIGNNPVILVANKLDILPADVHKNRIEDWLRRECKERGVVVSHIRLLSSTSKDGMDGFIVELEKLRRGRDVFVVGCSNVGKSTFINSLVQEYNDRVVFSEENGDETDKPKPVVTSKATTSIFPGTTLNVISVPLWKNSTLFDTPGVLNPYQMINLLTPDELKMVIPTKRIKPSIAHMFEGKSLCLGGLARIDYSGGLATFTVYTSTHLPLHICKTEKAEALFVRQRGKMLSPPIGQDRANEESMTLSQIKHFNIVPDKIDFRHTSVDLVVSGLGWIAIKSLSSKQTQIKLTVHTPMNIDVSLRDPLIPFTDTFNPIK
eukprot:gene4235-4940_t